MSEQSDIFKPDIYLEFKELDKSSLRSVVHYFEKNKRYLNQLDNREYFEVLVTYANAVFDLGQYYKFIRISEEILFLSIDQNIYEFEGEDIYCSILFKKAACHFNLDQKQKAEDILREMIKIYPNNQYVKSFYKKVLKREKSPARYTRAIAIAFILASAVVIAFELLVIRPFYSDWTEHIEVFRIFLFSLGFGVYLIGELISLLKVEWKVFNEIKSIKSNKGL